MLAKTKRDSTSTLSLFGLTSLRERHSDQEVLGLNFG